MIQIETHDLKEGLKVKLKKLNIGQKYGRVTAMDFMVNDQFVTIKGKGTLSNEGSFKIEEDPYYYSVEMIEYIVTDKQVSSLSEC